MKTRPHTPSATEASRLARWLGAAALLVAAALVPATALFAQEPDERVPVAILGGMMVFFVVCFLVMYVFVALALQTIARKTNTENGWFAWIPILNIILLLSIAKKPIWWIVLALIPLVNIVVIVLVWMGVAEARGKPSWWGILVLFPVVNLIAIGYLAWSD